MVIATIGIIIGFIALLIPILSSVFKSLVG